MRDESGSTAQMQQAAALLAVLATIPGLVLGKPGSISAEERCLDLWNFIGDPLKAIQQLDALIPLAPQMQRVRLYSSQQLCPDFIEVMRRVLEHHVHTLCLYMLHLSQEMGVLLLGALPRLAILHVTYLGSGAGFHHNLCAALNAACKAEGCQLELQINTGLVSKAKAIALCSEWVRVVQV